MISPNTLHDWLRYIESLHPHGAAGIELGLQRVSLVYAALGLSPKLPGVVVTIAGTNGKGSSVAMLEAIALAAGLRVAAFTSPHLLRYNERVRINGVDAPDDSWIRAFARVEQARLDVALTYFEFGTLAALLVMLEVAPELMLLEVGMGGRLDAVNVVDADAVLLTNVALDHVAMLGADREAIGYEKAGVMRAGQVVVLAEFAPPASVLAQANRLGLMAGQLLFQRDFAFALDVQNAESWVWRGLVTGMPTHVLPQPALAGAHQRDNAAGVVMLLEALNARGMLPVTITQEHMAAGLRQVRHPGRLQRLPAKVPVWLDVAHNPAGVETVAQAMRDWSCGGRTLVVFAVLADKDAQAMASLLAEEVDAWYLASLTGVRGRSSEDLAKALRTANTTQGFCIAATEASPFLAYTRALDDARVGDRIFILGSFLCVTDVLERLAQNGIANAV
ncbi:MAG: folylpolyglutamate synthase/dihydrofolate synthase family protein [Halothiobacillaceae bacterium]